MGNNHISTISAAMPPAGQSVLCKYKRIYIKADKRVGQWSDVAIIPVSRLVTTRNEFKFE